MNSSTSLTPPRLTLSRLTLFSGKLALFSGKGGVGKTTLSCAFARQWAKQFPEERLLLLSTDPAHSLGDVLESAIEDTPHPLPDLKNLQVRALDSEKLLHAFKTRYGEVLELLVERGSFVQGEDLTPVWNLNFPGLDELMGILEIQRILREQEADRIIVDMAPSGHTLNLFGLMDFLDGFLHALNLFQEKHRVISQSFTGKYSPDAADRFLADLQIELTSGRQLLQDRWQTACFVVAIAEPMSYLESNRFIQALETLGIPLGGIWVNRMQSAAKAAATATSLVTQSLVREQQETLQKLLAIADGKPVYLAPQQDSEPLGAIALDRLFQQIQPLTAAAFDSPLPQPSLSHSPLPAKLQPSLPDFLTEKKRLLLLGGKGGVGKTTVSAAIAWAMATRHPEQKIRVISIDPAHSLGDALGEALGHQPRSILTNLSAQEIDAKAILDQFRSEYLYELAEMMSGSAPQHGDRNQSENESLQLLYTPEAWRSIVSQTLPGIDEILSLLTVIDLLEQGEQDLIILDTAPTGHLLRFLEMPMALGDWLAWIFKLWIKYQDVIGRVEFMGRLRSLRQKVMQAQKKLTDASHTEFIGVFQGQAAIVAETARLTQTLANMNVSQRYLVQNRCVVAQDETCPYQPMFPQQSIVRLPQLPRGMEPIEQIKLAADLLF